MRLGAAALVSIGVLFAAHEARADPLPTNDYAIDLFQGPLLAPLRVIGIGGAYSAYAEGISGFVSNAAAPAVRPPYSFTEVSGDITGSVSFPLNLFNNNDFSDSGRRDYNYSSFVYLTGGAMLQAGPAGIGVLGELQSYTVASADGEKTHILVGKYHALAATSVFRGQAAVGAGIRAVTLGMSAPSIDLTMAGIAPEIGFLVRPDNLPFRAGATFRFPVSGTALNQPVKPGPDGLRRIGSFLLPREVVLPWELELGVAFQAGARPLNPPWIDPNEAEEPIEHRVALARKARARIHERTDAALPSDARAAYDVASKKVEEAQRREEEKYLDEEERYMEDQRAARFEALPRERLLVTLSLIVSGSVDDGIGIERFLAQGVSGQDTSHAIGTSGATPSFSPRLGLETEPILDVLETRTGTYYEPNRFGKVGRQHFTFGGDMRLFSTTFWGLIRKTTYCLSTAIDIAPRYQSASLGVGVWH